MKRVSTCMLLFLIIFVSCAPKKETDLENMDFTRIEAMARGTTVTFYMWGGSTLINAWIDSYVADVLKEKYSITLKRVPMDASVFVSKLLDQKNAGKARGSMDLLWINGENFIRRTSSIYERF